MIEIGAGQTLYAMTDGGDYVRFVIGKNNTIATVTRLNDNAQVAARYVEKVQHKAPHEAAYIADTGWVRALPDCRVAFAVVAHNNKFAGSALVF